MKLERKHIHYGQHFYYAIRAQLKLHIFFTFM